VDVNLNDTDDLSFAVTVKAALDLIRKHDPRRFRMVLRHLRYIVNVEIVSGGQYNHALRCCKIDFGRIPLDKAELYSDWYLAWIACVIVHEATHGRLESRWFAYTPTTRVQIERICRAEERRFATRLYAAGYDFALDLVPEFDPRQWRIYWKSSMRQRWEIMQQRYAESKEAEEAAEQEAEEMKQAV
jgi:hypothetical protein